MPTVVAREDYFDAAFTILGTGGHGGLKISALSSSIGVTSGSFYHHFGSWNGFVQDLLTYWEREQTDRIIALTATAPDALARMRRLKELSLSLPHAAEAAIRAWAATDDVVAEVQSRVDRERSAALTDVIFGVVRNRRRAHLLAVLGMSMVIGLQQWRAPVDDAELRALFDQYESMIVAAAPKSRGAR